MAESSRLNYLKILVLVLALYNVVVSLKGWNHPIDDQHAFRQTQTAISADYLKKDFKKFLDYETPVLGPPWKIPFEFPLYQSLVAGASTIFGTPLDQTGRLISKIFFFLCLIPVAQILKELGLPHETKWIFFALYLVSPVYTFWSRTFMIESMALYLGLSFIAMNQKFERSPAVLTGLGALGFGILASLVKITTFIGCAAFLPLLTVFRLPQTDVKAWFRLALRPSFLWSLGLTGISLVAGVLWTHHADADKSLSVLGAKLMSQKLQTWNFGTWEQRFDLSTWKRIFRERPKEVVGNGTVLLLALIAALVPKLPYRRFFWVFAAVYAVSPLIFFNLHFVHNYYTYANAIFALIALSILITGLLETELRFAAPIALTAILALSISAYFKTYWRGQGQPEEINLVPLAKELRGNTSAEASLLLFGLDWSAVVPYYAQRRALMSLGTLPEDQEMAQAVADLKSKTSVGALAFCNGEEKTPKFERRSKIYGLEHCQPVVSKGCKIFYANRCSWKL